MGKIFYKFRGTSKLEQLEFNDPFIKVLDLKRLIIKTRGMDKGKRDFNLLFTDENTGQKYEHPQFVIRNNTCINVRRLPSTLEKSIDLFEPEPIVVETPQPVVDEFGDDIYNDEKQMLAVMSFAKQYRSINIDDVVPQKQTPIPRKRHVYACFKCGIKGHRLEQCPQNQLAPTGIPKMFLKPIGDDIEGMNVSVANKDGIKQSLVIMPNQPKKRMRTEQTITTNPLLECRLCNRLFCNPVTFKCCFATFCEECAKQQLVNFKCPTCDSDSCVEDLLPNPKLNNAIKNMFALFCVVLVCLICVFLPVSLPQTPTELNRAIHEIAVSKSKTAIPVPVLCIGKRLYTGVIVHHAPKLGHVFQMIMEHKNNRYTYRSQILVVTIDYECVEHALECVLALCQPKTSLVLPTNTRVKYLTFIRPIDTHYSLFGFYYIPPIKRIDEIVLQHFQLDPLVYYRSSTRREMAIREAYASDTQFQVQTLTGLIHAIVLQSMFPHMKFTWFIENDLFHEYF